jgi:hypothetical protein
MSGILNKAQIEQFITDGFIRIDDAFPAATAKEAVDILWRDIPFDRHAPETWIEPVVWLGMYAQSPFIASVNSDKLYAIFNQLAGVGNWLPCKSVGAFPVRFPSAKASGDTGIHVDAGFPGEDPNDYFGWRINVRSKGRALLMLILYSDVSAADAPTVIYKGSHMHVARLLYPYGDAGLSFSELAGKLHDLSGYEKVLATGNAGTIYLCHPHIAHAAQPHHGHQPRFMAQPPLLMKGAIDLDDDINASPVAQAIHRSVKQ